MTNVVIIESVWRELHDYQLGSSVSAPFLLFYCSNDIFCCFVHSFENWFFLFTTQSKMCNSHLSFEYETDRLQSGAYVQIASCHNAFNQRHQMIYFYPSVWFEEVQPATTFAWLVWRSRNFWPLNCPKCKSIYLLLCWSVNLAIVKMWFGAWIIANSSELWMLIRCASFHSLGIVRQSHCEYTMKNTT